jgi:hypothetical protein
MAVNSRHFDGLTPTQVFDVLRDGKTYGYWVVGTRGTREVSGDWPQPGTAIRYTTGIAPVRKDDRTESVSYDPDRRLALEAYAWPFGSLSIVITVEPSGSGSTVVIHEEPKKGILKTLHNPLVDLSIKARNVETLRRLEKCAREKASVSG